MNIKQYIWTIGLLATLLLAACTTADTLDERTAEEPRVSVSTEQYINLHIVNGSAATTRATTNEERAIYDGIICLFEGATEGTAILKTSVSIDQLVNNPGNSAEVNITQRLAVGSHPYQDGQKRYVLVLLNTTSSGFRLSGTDLYHNNTSLTGQTLATLQNVVIDDVGSAAEHAGLYMSNVPQADGTIMPEATALYDTEAAAHASGASRVDIHVERAAAKVTVKNETALLTNIHINGVSTAYPKVHRLTWTVNNYHTHSYALRHAPSPYANWATSCGTDELVSYSASDFGLYPIQLHGNDDVYLAENTTATPTEIIVELQLKDASNMLIHEAFLFHPFGEHTDLYTSAESYIYYLQTGFPLDNMAAYHLQNRSREDVFKHATLIIQDNGSVKLTLVNSDFNATEQQGLSDLADFLSSVTTGFRDGKMYYTYTIKHDTDHTYGVVRNNAYTLTINDAAIQGIGRHQP